MFAPAGTPQEIIDKISRDTEEAMSEPDVQKLLFDQGFVTFRNSPQEFADFVKADLTKWAALWKSIQKN